MKRIAFHTIVLTRDGKRFTVKPGQTVDLTQAEIDSITASNKDALKKPTDASQIDEVKLPALAEAPTGGQTGSGRGARVRGGNRQQEHAPTGDDTGSGASAGDDNGDGL